MDKQEPPVPQLKPSRGAAIVFGLFMIFFGMPFLFGGGGIPLILGIQGIMDGEFESAFMIVFSLPFIATGAGIIFFGIKMMLSANKLDVDNDGLPDDNKRVTKEQLKLIEVKYRERGVYHKPSSRMTRSEAREILRELDPHHHSHKH